jgi:hypothetical protein
MPHGFRENDVNKGVLKFEYLATVGCQGKSLLSPCGIDVLSQYIVWLDEQA